MTIIFYLIVSGHYFLHLKLCFHSLTANTQSNIDENNLISGDLGKIGRSDMTKELGNLQSLVSETEHVLFWHMASK